MKFAELLEIVGDEPVFSSSLALAGDVDPVDVASQLSRWVAAGKLIALRRGVYAIAEPYRRRDPHAFELANAIVRPSYVSLESALSFHGMIPEAVFSTTSVARTRPAEYETALGRFTYRVISADLFWGYSAVPVAADRRQRAYVALPEKALLDLVYLRPHGDDADFLEQLRLDGLDTLDTARLVEFAQRSGKPKLKRAAASLLELVRVYKAEWGVS
jgi:predicted transcriptional regulator of viral defense system